MKNKTTKEELLEKSYDLFYLNGYNGVSIKDICATVGILKGSFYNYFQDKEAFAIEMIKYYSNKWHEYLSRFLLDTKYPPRERFKRFFKHLVLHYGKELSFTRGCMTGNFAQELGDLNEKIAFYAEESFIGAKNIIEQAFTDALFLGEIEDTEVTTLADYTLNSIQGALIRMKSSRNAQPLLNLEEIFFKKLYK